jgi:hypothetical protein
LPVIRRADPLSASSANQNTSTSPAAASRTRSVRGGCSNTHYGELHDLRAKDAAESSLFASHDGIRIKLFLRVDHGGYTTGDTFGIALTTYPNWHVSVAGKPHAVLGDFESIYSNSLKAIVQSTLQFAVTRHDAVSGETEAMLVTDGAKETVLSLRMSFVNKPATDKEVSV